MADPLAELEAAGVPLDGLSQHQREALQDLTPEEVSVLVSVLRRLHGDPEVSAHMRLEPEAEVIGGVLF